MLLIPEARVRWLGVAFGVVFTLNLLAAIPPTPRIGALLPVDGPLGIAGSIAMLAITVACLRSLRSRPPRCPRPSQSRDEPDRLRRIGDLPSTRSSWWPPRSSSVLAASSASVHALVRPLIVAFASVVVIQLLSTGLIRERHLEP